MWKIYIEHANRSDVSVTLQKRDGEIYKNIITKQGDIDLVTAISEILGEKKLKLSQINAFEFSSEGKSFTGVKMAAAVANVLNWAVLNIPVEKLKMPEYKGEPNVTIK